MDFIEKKVKKPKKHGFFPSLSENGPKICQKNQKYQIHCIFWNFGHFLR